ncbi:hypothetical protein GOEFS_039_00300 [Gordonia effusa NBRC 100432]|uniref:DUF4259 domain-containing protein n=1 Tax=Gordonia effusa NBRC 100432 TaxID=1077974 RepID=H0QY95_9ACTN|nr:DUF4259 domain-containing protein [Gordonia effusa]GAB17796.1 hypothetical protein GOEFS_039_00300 [Gordonia effusa NBRC 100432]
MGAWGNGPFDNDDAGDWVDEFDEADAEGKLELLQETFQLERDSPLKADQSYAVIAAAATVAALVPGGPSVDEAYGPQSLEDADFVVSDVLRDAAREALSIVTAPETEWSELWAEVDGRDAALEQLRPVFDALRRV